MAAPLELLAQKEADTLSISIETGVLIRSQEFNPYYLTYNRWGIISDHQDAFVGGEGNFLRGLSDNWSVESKLAFRNEVLSEAYAALNWKKFKLFGGRRRQVLGGIENNRLTTGSLALGRNALPIPQIGLESDYLDLPLSHGVFKIKGGISHGWFERDRNISKALLHQKYATVLVDLESLIGLKIHSSIIHFAQYGGISLQGEKQPSSFKDFQKVFFGQGIPNPLGGTRGESNAVGNHLGVTQWTLNKRFGKWRVKLHHQKPFEDLGSMQYLSLTDYLNGLEVMFPKESKVVKVYLEYIQTKWQSGPGLPDPTDDIDSETENFGYPFGGRDDFFNNYLYQSGWTYNGNIISNPLFLTYNRSAKFLGQFPDYGVQIVNNRLKAYHLGIEIEPSEKLYLKTMVTYSINYGTYAGLYEGRFAWNGIKIDPDFDYVFRGGKKQFYSLVEVSLRGVLFQSAVTYKAIFAADTGELYDNLGVELSIQFMLKSH